MRCERILITGGTGSLGQALTRFLLEHTTATILIFSRDEYKQMCMRQVFGTERVRYFLGDVRDLPRLMLACRDVDLVFHTAALKYIDVGEYNPSEFIATNITGTDCVAKACIEHGVQTAVFISSDKAVSPVNLYGSTKSTAEALWRCANAYDPQGCRFVTVRYGNVAGSRGSVIPLWQAALRDGTPLPVTDLTMTRFWISLDEAVMLAWYAAQYAPRGALLVPNLPAYMLDDLAQALIEEAGVDWEAIQWHPMGVRPGEKLHERLMTEDEMARSVLVGIDEYFEIPPVAPSWPYTPSSDDRLPFGPYTSDAWKWRLGVNELRQKLREMQG